MATTLFFRSAAATTHLGHNNINLRGTAIGWRPLRLQTARGASLVEQGTNTVAGTTPGVEVRDGSPNEWLSDPLAADVTISGSITWNLWAFESSMSANVAINARVEKIDGATGAITLIDQTARATELGTTTAAVNFSETPAAGVACKKGDRLRIRVFGDDAGTMASGFSFTFGYNGATGGASGDSFVTFTETFTFLESDPSGTKFYLRDGPPTGLDSSHVDVTDWATPGTVTNQGTSQPDWTGLGNVAASDDAYATCTTGATNGTDQLFCTNFGFVLPANAIVRGVEVEIEAKSDSSTLGQLQYRWVGIGGASLGATDIFIANLTTSDVVYTHGGLNYLSGIADDFDDSVIEHADFGVRIYSDENGVYTMSIDQVRVRIYYTTAGRWKEHSLQTTAGTSVSPDGLKDFNTAGWFDPRQVLSNEVLRGQWVDNNTNGTPIEWYTNPLEAFTLGGLAKLTGWFAEEGFGANLSVKAELAVVDNDGSNPTVWAYWNMSCGNDAEGELTTTAREETIYLSGDDLSVSAGQRLRLRIFTDDTAGTAAGDNFFAILSFDDDEGSSGDSQITFTQTITEQPQMNPADFAALYREPEFALRLAEW